MFQQKAMIFLIVKQVEILRLYTSVHVFRKFVGMFCNYVH